jgi:hypothetical protein
VCVCMFEHNSGTPGAISTKLDIYIYVYINGCVCLCVCMFQHNSGMPGAISTKLGTHMTIYSIYIKMDVCKS